MLRALIDMWVLLVLCGAYLRKPLLRSYILHYYLRIIKWGEILKRMSSEELSAEQRILDAGYEDVIIFSGDTYDAALVGISEDGRAIYDYDLMVEWLVAQDNITPEEAMEWIDYNVIRSLPYVGDKAPIIMFGLE